MAKRRKKKSKASREKRILRRRARRSKRRARRVASSPAPKRRRRRSRKSVFKRRSRKVRAHRRIRRKARRSRSRARRGIKNVVASKGTRVVVRKVRRGRVRYAKKRSGRRVGVVGVNASALSLTGGITGFLGNAKATVKDGVKGFAWAFGGAAASVVGGSFVSQITGNVVAKFAPSLLANPVVSRLLGAVNYYLPGWAASRFIPGLSGKARRAMLTGAAAAALAEVIRPGIVRQTLSQVPAVGRYLSDAEDQAGDLGAYVGYALNGNQDGDRGFSALYDENGNPRTGDGVGEYLTLGEYVPVQGDAVENIGVADYFQYAR